MAKKMANKRSKPKFEFTYGFADIDSALEERKGMKRYDARYRGITDRDTYRMRVKAGEIDKKKYAPRPAKFVGYNSSSPSSAPLFKTATLNGARRKALKEKAPYVQIERVNGGSVGRVNKNKKGAFWTTTNKAGTRSSRFVVGKDGSLIGYSGKTSGKKINRAVDSWEYEPVSKFDLEDYFE